MDREATKPINQARISTIFTHSDSLKIIDVCLRIRTKWSELPKAQLTRSKFVQKRSMQIKVENYGEYPHSSMRDLLDTNTFRDFYLILDA